MAQFKPVQVAQVNPVWVAHIRAVYPISKHIELKTWVSIRKFIDESKKMVDGEILNHITKKIVTVKAQQTQKIKELIEKNRSTVLKGTSQED